MTTFDQDCRRVNSDCDSLLAALLANDRSMPAVVVEKDGDRGIAFLPSCHSSLGPQSAKILVFWRSGRITAGDFVQDIIGDAWEIVNAQ